MNGKSFVDSNILLYAGDACAGDATEPDRQRVAESILTGQTYFGVSVVNPFADTWPRTRVRD